MNCNEITGVLRTDAAPRRARFIAATADLSARGKPTIYPNECIKNHKPGHVDGVNRDQWEEGSWVNNKKRLNCPVQAFPATFFTSPVLFAVQNKSSTERPEPTLFLIVSAQQKTVDRFLLQGQVKGTSKLCHYWPDLSIDERHTWPW